MIVDGLSWWQSWLCVWFGYTISALFVVAMGRIATIYHVPFAVANRASFGTWGSFWPVINRAAMAVIWFGVQVGILGTTMDHLLTLGSRTLVVSNSQTALARRRINIDRRMHRLDDQVHLDKL